MNSPELQRGGVRTPEEVVMDIVRRPVSRRDIRLKSYTGAYDFNRLQLGDSVLQLLLDTSEFLPRAASYRDFKVAAGALCVGANRRYGRVLGYNIKVDDTDSINIHAEDQITIKALDADFTAISVLAVIGQPQEDHASGKLLPTLMPCGRCRERLSLSPLVSDDTLFISARPDFTVLQFGNLHDIQNEHDGKGESSMMTFEFPETPAILRPRSVPDEWEPNPAPRDFEEIDSTDYDSRIGTFLLSRYASM